MIVAPDWTTLRRVAVGLDAHDPIVQKRAVERVIDLIHEELPDIVAVRLYDVDAELALVRLATDKPEKAATPLSELPALQDNTLERDASRWTPDDQQWLYPLYSVDGRMTGALEVVVPELDVEWVTWLEVIASQIEKSFALSQNTVQPRLTPDNIQRQTNKLIVASRMLLVSETYDDMATAVMYACGEAVSAVALTLFEQPFSVHGVGAEGVTSNRRYSAAFGTRQGVELLEREATLGSLPEQSFITSLRQQIPIIIDNVETDAGYLSGWMREKSIAHKARQVTVFGLVTNEQVIGTLEMFSAQRYALSQAEIDLYEALANQLGNVILSKRLLHQSLEAQQFASQLVKTNKAIAEAETYEDMARAVLKDAPDDITAVAIALFNRPFTLMGTPSNLRTYAIVTRDGALETDFVDYFSAADDARVTYFLHEYLEGRMMLLWSISRPRQPVLAQNLVAKLAEVEANVITSFGLNMSNSLRGLLIFTGLEDLRDPGARYDGLRAIADQLAAVIENRILLQQANEALDLIQNQYETSSRVFRSPDLASILKAVFNFAGGAFSQAHLVTTDLDGSPMIVAEGDSSGFREVSRPTTFDSYPASATLYVLEALEVRDVNEDAFLSEDERAQMREAGVVALVILPILSNEVLSGLMMLTDTAPTRIPPDRLRAMRSLADQVGVVLENHKLLQSTEASLLEIQILYDANRAMLRTQSSLDVLRVLKQTLATDAAAICQLSAHYDDDADGQNLQSLILDYDLTYNNEEHAPQASLTSDPTALNETQRYLRQLEDSVVFAPKVTPIPGNPVRYIQDKYPLQSYATLVIRDQGRVTNLIYILFDWQKPFVDSTRRLYEAIADQVSAAIANQHLLRESRQFASQLSEQLRVLQTISDFVTRVNTFKSERELLAAGAQVLVQATGVDHAGAILFAEDSQTGVVSGEYPLTETGIGVTVSTKDNPVTLPDFDLNSVVIVADVSQRPASEDNIWGDFRKQGVGAVMIVPLVGLNDELIGSVGLDVYGRPHHFSAGDARTARTIAAQMAVGLQNVRLLMDAQQRAEQLQRITDFGQVAQATLNLEDMLAAALTNVPRLLPVSHITMTLYDELREELILAGGWQETDSLRQPITDGQVVPRLNTTTGYVFESGRYLYIPDIQQGTQLDYPYADAIQTLLAMPLTNRGRTLGVMTVGAAHADAYSDTDIALFQQMVNQMAVAIDNARAYTQSQRVAHNKTLANEISVQLQQQNDITQMIDLTMREVGRAIGAKRGRIRLSTRQSSLDDDSGA